jgi:hypothetical protein
LFLSLVFVLSACLKPPVPQPKDDANNGNNNEELESVFPGTWTYHKIIMTNGTLKGAQQELGTFNGIGKDIKGSFEISEDPNTFTTTLEYTAAVNMTIFGQTQQTDMPVQERTVTGTWTESNGELSLKADDGSTVDVKSSSASQIVFSGTFLEQMTLGQFSVDAEADVEFTLVK